MPKKAYIGAKMALFGQNILIILGGSISENQLGTLFALFLAGHSTKLIRMVNIWPKITQSAYFEPNLAVFGPTILFCLREGAKVLVLTYQKTS